MRSECKDVWRGDAPYGTVRSYDKRKQCQTTSWWEPCDTLTGSSVILPHQSPYHLTRMRELDVYISWFSLSLRSPHSKGCLCFFFFFFFNSAAQVALKGSMGIFSMEGRCVIYRSHWQNCPKWVLSLSALAVKISQTQHELHIITQYSCTSSLPFSHSTHSTVCSFTANYRTPLNEPHDPSQCATSCRWLLYIFSKLSGRGCLWRSTGGWDELSGMKMVFFEF